MKKYIILFFVIISHTATGQVENITSIATDTISSTKATDEGSGIISGLISFSSLSGRLNTGFRNDPITTINFSPSYLYFISDRLGLGVTAGFTRISQRDASASSWGFGPQISYYFDSSHTAIPYLGGSLNYISINDSRRTATGIGTNVGGGILIRKGHLGFTIQGGYQYDSVKRENTIGQLTGGTVYFRFGFVGLLY